MKWTTCAVWLLAAVATGVAHAQKHGLVWHIEALTADPAAKPRAFRQGTPELARQQVRTLCDLEMAKRASWPETSAIRVVVSPMVRAEVKLKTMEFQCAEVRANPQLLVSEIREPTRKTPEPRKDVIQLWD